MNFKRTSWLLAMSAGMIFALSFSPAKAIAQGTAFTYQGRLNDGANPATGIYDLRFTIYDAVVAGAPTGGSLTNAATPVTNGLFTVMLDFGNQFPGADRWLEIGVRTNGSGAFSTLTPRQPLTPVPYAIFANTANNLTGTITAAQLPSAVVLNSGVASGINATALGSFTSAGDYDAIAMGNATIASGIAATSMGISTVASGNASTAMGYATHAGGIASATMGYNTIASGNFSLAAGYDSQAINNGTFVWADAVSPTSFTSTADNQFLIRATGGVGVGTANPQGSLHVFSANNPTVFRLQSSGTPGFGRLEFASNPQGDVNEWRPGYIQSTDNGGFTGGLAFFVNGSGSGSRFGSNEVMRVVNGTVGIGTTSPSKPLVVQKRSQFEPAIMVGGAWPGGPRIQTYGLDADPRAWMGLGSDMGGGPYEHSVYFPVGDNNNGKLTIGSCIGGTNYSTKLTVDAQGNIIWGNGSMLSSDANGIIELGSPSSPGQQPIIDFHFGVGSVQDYNVRLINDLNETLTLFRAGSPIPMARFNSSSLTVNGTFVSASDRNLKENFQPVNAQEVLNKVAALPLSRWNYKADLSQQHVGPMAQDFYAAFGVGPDDRHITTIDEGGVALAAIQGLNQKLEQKESEIADLKARLEKLEQILMARKGAAQ